MPILTSRRAGRVAALALTAAFTTFLGLASTPSASAHWSGVIGAPGPYNVTASRANDHQVMIEAYRYDGRPTFFTNGVTVARSTATTHDQTVVARYRLERWSEAINSWVPMTEASRSREVGGYVPGAAYTPVVIDGWWFTVPTMAGPGSMYRVMYTVEWWDDVTGEELGYRDVYPDAYNNVCPQEETTCQVYTEGIRW